MIRDYQPGDFQQLFSLWQELDMGGAERGDSPEIISQTIEMGGRLLVVEDPASGELIGSSWLTFDGRRIFLHHFGIKKKYQRKGYGMQLAVESLRVIRQKGYQVKLEVHQDNIAAIRLYEKLGFCSFPGYDIYMIRKPGEIEPDRFV